MGNYYKKLQPNSAETRLGAEEGGGGVALPEEVKRSWQIKSTEPPTDGIYRFAANTTEAAESLSSAAAAAPRGGNQLQSSVGASGARWEEGGGVWASVTNLMVVFFCHASSGRELWTFRACERKECSEAAGSFLKHQPRVGFAFVRLLRREQRQHESATLPNNDSQSRSSVFSPKQCLELDKSGDAHAAAKPSKLPVRLSSHSAIWFHKVASRCCYRCDRVGIFWTGLLFYPFFFLNPQHSTILRHTSTGNTPSRTVSHWVFLLTVAPGGVYLEGKLACSDVPPLSRRTQWGHSRLAWLKCVSKYVKEVHCSHATRPQRRFMERETVVEENRHCVKKRSFGASALFTFSAAAAAERVFSLRGFGLFHWSFKRHWSEPLSFHSTM